MCGSVRVLPSSPPETLATTCVHNDSILLALLLMPPSSKAKAAGVSASSFLDLKSELAKKETEFAKRKATGKTYDVGSSRGSIEGDSGRVSARTSEYFAVPVVTNQQLLD